MGPVGDEGCEDVEDHAVCSVELAVLLVTRRNHEAHDGHVEPKDGDEVEEEPPRLMPMLRRRAIVRPMAMPDIREATTILNQ